MSHNFVIVVLIYHIDTAFRMFGSFESAVVGFNSSWKTERISTEGECQTQEFESKHVGSSSVASKSKCTQTEILECNQIPLPLGINTWLRGLAPTVLKELTATENSPVFKGYDPHTHEEESETTTVKLLHRIHPLEDGDKLEFLGGVGADCKLSVIDICWSGSGNSLAVGYGLPYHEHWCLHDGFVHIFIKSSTRHILQRYGELRLPACTSVMAYHPKESYIFAAASVSGDICVWNIQQQGHGTFVVSCKERLPNRVASLLWLTKTQAQHIILNKDVLSSAVLVSGSVDGTVIIWLVDKQASTIIKHKRYELHKSANTQFIPSDITCMDFLKIIAGETQSEFLKADVFVVGCRTGDVMLCQMSSAKSITGSTDLNPFVSCLEPHGGCVLSLSFSSPSHRPLLLTLGADLEIRVYVVPQDYPIQILSVESQLSAVAWMPGSDALVVGTDGTRLTLQVFDITLGKKLFLIDGSDEIGLDTKSAESISSYGLTSLTFNSKSPHILACGDTRGVVYVWNFPLQSSNDNSPLS